MKRPKKVLIVLFGAIGDVVRAMPLAVRIKQSWPDAELSWAIEPKSEPVLRGHTAVDHVEIFQRRSFSSGGLVEYVKFVKRLRSQKFDLVIDLQRHFKSGVTAVLSGAPSRLAFNRKNSKEFNWLFATDTIEPVENFTAKIMHYQHFGDRLGLEKVARLEFGIHPTVEALAKVDSLLTSNDATKQPNRNLVALLLGSSWPSRFWTAEQYCEVIAMLGEMENKTCVLVGDKSELEISKEILANTKRPVIDCVGKVPLADLSALMSRVGLAIGPDCGPMHIAAAVGTPVVSLWGSTSPERSAPYRNESYVLQSAIGCSPCYRRTCPGLGNLCMRDIPAMAVFAMAQKAQAACLDRPIK